MGPDAPNQQTGSCDDAPSVGRRFSAYSRLTRRKTVEFLIRHVLRVRARNQTSTLRLSVSGFRRRAEFRSLRHLVSGAARWLKRRQWLDSRKDIRGLPADAPGFAANRALTSVRNPPASGSGGRSRGISIVFECRLALDEAAHRWRSWLHLDNGLRAAVTVAGKNVQQVCDSIGPHCFGCPEDIGVEQYPAYIVLEYFQNPFRSGLPGRPG